MTPKQPIDVAVNIELPPEQVWDYVKDIESHTDWMRDASAIRITSDSVAGKGTTFECDTKIGPFRLVDKMEITDWVDNEVMGVRHEAHPRSAELDFGRSSDRVPGVNDHECLRCT